MLARLTTLALLVALAAGGKLVFPTTTSKKPTGVSSSSQTSCPYPLPLGATLQSVRLECYEVTDEEDPYVPLVNVNDVNCSQNYVYTSDGRCVKVVKRRPTPKSPKGPSGVPDW